jgi:D-alanyl-D-alanine dipeptidase
MPISEGQVEDDFGFKPKEKTFKALPDYDLAKWVELKNSKSVKVDMRYATSDNFMKEVIYPCGRCFLRPEVADSLENVIEKFRKLDLGIILYDCFRPLPAQQKLWDIMPNAMYVTPPWKGSMHNRGHAIDVGLIDLKTNQILDMGTSFDFFGKEAHYAFSGLPKEIIDRRVLLRTTMEKHGFSGIRTEWWHFSLKKNLMPLSDWEWLCE